SAEIVIRVRDSGPGIPPKIRERLFFPFFTSKPGGSGMGLAVARKIVESHHGILDVDSGTGRGATFIVKLPLRESLEPIPGKGAGR
ncbi:MAG TPA: ATP-binding protein, partial [Candidatus Polarisedimenticolia bacterium]|nr:ATP-binding protein [Candidatus Polarisedimenticolia bacterium]